MHTRPQSQVAQKATRKGFTEQVSKPVDPSYPTSPAAELLHNKSQFILKETALSWPELSKIKISARQPWTIPSLKARIAELRIEHKQQLAKAIKYRIHEENQLHKEQYLTVDELEDWTTPSNITEDLKSLHRMERQLAMHQSDDFISHIRYIHIMALKPLLEKLRDLAAVEERAKLQRALRFPKSSQAWRQMDTRDAKLKVARFLVADKKQQEEQISNNSVWKENRSDISAVILEYNTNVMFNQEVLNFIKANMTTDPRRRGA
ncbi:hypothetical protein BU17DRAFT_96897 [Hysterangium stoloniferum]|nr:hypothetical protein BU17DRAFT_96897 [Hysterangium stoloniferum]